MFSEYRGLTISEKDSTSSIGFAFREPIVGLNIIPILCADSDTVMFYEYTTPDVLYTQGDALKDYCDGVIENKLFGIIKEGSCLTYTSNVTWNPSDKITVIYLNGYRAYRTDKGATVYGARAYHSKNSGKYYIEMIGTKLSSNDMSPYKWNTTLGIVPPSTTLGTVSEIDATGYLGELNKGIGLYAYHDGTSKELIADPNIDDGYIMMAAIDLDNWKIWFGYNGVWSGSPEDGTGEAFTLTPDTYNIVTTLIGTDDPDIFLISDQDIFYYTPPTGFGEWTGDYTNAEDKCSIGNVFLPAVKYDKEFKLRPNYLDEIIEDYVRDNFILPFDKLIDYSQLPSTIDTQGIVYDTTEVRIGSSSIFQYDGTNHYDVANMIVTDCFFNAPNEDYYLGFIYDSTILQLEHASYSGTYDQTILFTRHLPDKYEYTSIEVFVHNTDFLIKLNGFIYILYKDDTTYITIGQSDVDYKVILFKNTYYLLEDIGSIVPEYNSFKYIDNVFYDFEKEIYYSELSNNIIINYIKDIRYSNVFRFKEFNDSSDFPVVHNDCPIFHYVYNPTYNILMEVENETNIVVDRYSKVIIDKSWRNLKEGMILLTNDPGYAGSYMVEDNYLKKYLTNLTLITGKKINNTYYRRII